jgi:zinc/manganese transport system substrate-binding protein
LNRLVSLALALALVTVALSPVILKTQAQSSAVPVVVTFSILGDIVQNVGGDRIALTTLVGPDGEIHEYEPTPADARALGSAAMLVENGLGVESWIDRLYSASRSSARRVVITEGIDPLRVEDGERRGEVDPHMWHDPVLVRQMVTTVRTALSEVDPANAEVYAANAATYTARLQELDDWIRTQVETVPPQQRKLVTAHDTFGYFARRYGFEIVGFAIPSFAPGAQPSARELGALSQVIRTAGVGAVFPDNVSNARLVERVAQEARVSVAPALYTDSLGGPSSAGSTYLRMMQYNVTTVVSALRGWR